MHGTRNVVTHFRCQDFYISNKHADMHIFISYHYHFGFILLMLPAQIPIHLFILKKYFFIKIFLFSFQNPRWICICIISFHLLKSLNWFDNMNKAKYTFKTSIKYFHFMMKTNQNLKPHWNLSFWIIILIHILSFLPTSN